eukprot:gene32614-17631_t
MRGQWLLARLPQYHENRGRVYGTGMATSNFSTTPPSSDNWAPAQNMQPESNDVLSSAEAELGAFVRESATSVIQRVFASNAISVGGEEARIQDLAERIRHIFRTSMSACVRSLHARSSSKRVLVPSPKHHTRHVRADASPSAPQNSNPGTSSDEGTLARGHSSEDFNSQSDSSDTTTNNKSSFASSVTVSSGSFSAMLSSNDDNSGNDSGSGSDDPSSAGGGSGSDDAGSGGGGGSNRGEESVDREQYGWQ